VGEGSKVSGDESSNSRVGEANVLDERELRKVGNDREKVSSGLNGKELGDGVGEGREEAVSELVVRDTE